MFILWWLRSRAMSQCSFSSTGQNNWRQIIIFDLLNDASKRSTKQNGQLKTCVRKISILAVFEFSVFNTVCKLNFHYIYNISFLHSDMPYPLFYFHVSETQFKGNCCFILTSCLVRELTQRHQRSEYLALTVYKLTLSHRNQISSCYHVNRFFLMGAIITNSHLR